ncbi:MAG TPA: hypothetical protein PKE04_13095, partial [Clostridia bacterium]|nr:hypothetical protein [Clostridia bacterium]
IMDTASADTQLNSASSASAEESQVPTVSFANSAINNVRLSGNTANLPLAYSAQDSGLTGTMTYSYTINDKTYSYGSSVAVYLTGKDENLTFNFSDGVQNAIANGETVSTITVMLGTPTGGFAKGANIVCTLNIQND